MDYYGWRPYVSAGQRRKKAATAAARLTKGGRVVSPVRVDGRKIATTFWGKAWCENLERYSDYSNRLPRGRTYVRNGSVIDLQIAGGEIKALVSGSDIYEVEVKITAVSKARWQSICADCAGAIDSLIELLRGRLSQPVMERVCQPDKGLFPAPSQIHFSCSCPDWAGMCKHVAAVLYGIGARLDHQPELLFRLNQVDEQELIRGAGASIPMTAKRPSSKRVLADENLSELFGVDLGDEAPKPAKPKRPAVAKKAKAKAKSTRKR